MRLAHVLSLKASRTHVLMDVPLFILFFFCCRAIAVIQNENILSFNLMYYLECGGYIYVPLRMNLNLCASGHNLNLSYIFAFVRIA